MQQHGKEKCVTDQYLFSLQVQPSDLIFSEIPPSTLAQQHLIRNISRARTLALASYLLLDGRGGSITRAQLRQADSDLLFEGFQRQRRGAARAHGSENHSLLIDKRQSELTHCHLLTSAHFSTPLLSVAVLWQTTCARSWRNIDASIIMQACVHLPTPF